MKKIPVRCECSAEAPVGKLESIQGNLKQREDLAKLRASVETYGVVFPSFTYREKGKRKILDGVGRNRVYSELQAEGLNISVPVVDIPVKDEQDAKKKLLLASASYGKTDAKKFKGYSQGLSAPSLAYLSKIDFAFLYKQGKGPTIEAPDIPEPKKISVRPKKKTLRIEFSTDARMREFLHMLELIRQAKYPEDEAATVLHQIVVDYADGLRS